MPQPLYIFIDESGDFNFTKNGTSFYTFTAVMTYEPTAEISAIKDLQIALISGQQLPGLDNKYIDEHISIAFHACEDKQAVRNLFFGQITGMTKFWANSVVVRKNMTYPPYRDPKVFYSKYLGSLLKYVLVSYEYSDVCILVDGCAVSKEKKIFKQTIADEIMRRNPATKFRVFFPPSGCFCHLQIVDYINWAIFRKWEQNDVRSYELIKGLLASPERDIFKYGFKKYY